MFKKYIFVGVLVDAWKRVFVFPNIHWPRDIFYFHKIELINKHLFSNFKRINLILLELGRNGGKNYYFSGGPPCPNNVA